MSVTRNGTTRIKTQRKEVDTYDEMIAQKRIWRIAERKIIELIVKDVSQDILAEIKDIEDEDRKLRVITRHVFRGLNEML